MYLLMRFRVASLFRYTMADDMRHIREEQLADRAEKRAAFIFKKQRRRAQLAQLGHDGGLSAVLTRGVEVRREEGVCHSSR